jgi:hypothetical protein
MGGEAFPDRMALPVPPFPSLSLIPPDLTPWVRAKGLRRDIPA